MRSDISPLNEVDLTDKGGKIHVLQNRIFGQKMATNIFPAKNQQFCYRLFSDQ